MARITAPEPPFPGWSFQQVAAAVTWFVVGLPLVLERLQGPVAGSFGLWLACYLAFGVLQILVSEPRLDRYLRHETLLPLLALTLLAFGVIVFGGLYDLGSILLIIVMSYAAHLLPFRAALLWMITQTLVMVVIFAWGGNDPVDTALQTILSFGFQMFALFTTHAALSEERAKERLTQVNAELRATQALLAESSRTAERLRIARELHDLIGHHLTALSLNLEVASHLTEGRAAEHVGKAQGIAKALLGDVRVVVSRMREPDELNVAEALELLIRDIPKLTVHLQVAEDLGIGDPQRAQVVLRCAQEIITNAVKHAGAQTLWLELRRSDQGLILSAHDDGRGSAQPTFAWGNGLTGMRERLEALGGRLEVASAAGRGFALTATLPL